MEEYNKNQVVKSEQFCAGQESGRKYNPLAIKELRLHISAIKRWR